MYFFISAALIVVSILLFLYLLGHVSEPDFLLKGFLSEESLRLAVSTLAAKCTAYRLSGKGLSLRLIKRYTERCYAMISSDALFGAAFEFENRLYDGFYIIRDKTQIVKRSLSRLHSLPHVGGLPRVYLFCQLVVKACEGAVSETLLRRMTEEFNSVTPLTYDEVTCLPLCLRYALLEFLAIYSSKAVMISNGRREAARDVKKRQVDLSNLNKNSYIYYFLKHADSELAGAFRSVCEKNDIFMDEKNETFIHLVSSYNGAVESAFYALQSLEAWLTDEYLINLSTLHLLFEGENKTYSRCTLPTKNVYLYHVARRARKARIGELAYGRRIIDSSAADNVDIAERILPRAGSKVAMRFYIAAILLFAAGLCILAWLLAGSLSVPIAILTFPTAVALALIVAGELNGRLAFRRYLPHITLADSALLDSSLAADSSLAEGSVSDSAAGKKALIVFCGLAASKKEIEQLFFNLQTVRYANPHPVFKYGLLLDFPAGDERQPGDTELLEECKKQYSLLKEDRFNVYVRRRKEVGGAKTGKNKYQGWEKKRGALLELNNYLLSDEESSADFSLILGARTGIKYVITLDTDTMLNSAVELVEIMEHPANSKKYVVSLNARANPYAITTAFARVMCGGTGLSSYDNGSADINYDLFDSGNYTGKGIYRLKEFNDKLKDFFPDNRVLSHDFIEGAVCGCGVSECAVDHYPATFSQYMARSVRWLRGDWQLLPYLFKKVRTRDGERIKNPVSPIAKWHIFCNMLFSLLPITVFASLVLGLFDSRPLVSILIALSYSIAVLLNSIRHTILKLKIPFADILRALFWVAVLPVTVFYNLCGIIVTLYRLITKRRLLEWKVFAHATQKTSFIPSVLAAAFFAFTAVFLHKSWIFYIISGLFMSGIALVLFLNRNLRDKQHLPDSFRQKLLETARKTWKYFEKAGSEEQHVLVPDNLQLHLNKGFAHRTSPTNIGFSLLAPVCAYELGFITLVEMQARLTAVVTQIERLEKWHGNLYNWMDTNGRLLYPKYVSSVDNGNLLACLLATNVYAEGGLSERIEKLVKEMDLGRLYDEKRGLMRIGFNQSERVFDGHYDLMASESMLMYLVAVGTGKIHRKSFSNLSRHALKAYGRVALASWSGGMFEYLMSAVFVKYPALGMLNSSAKAVIKAHRKYCKNAPFWGMSESQYNYTDEGGNYQYRAFGVPWICNSNNPRKRVLSPYASFLALPFAGKAVESNLGAIEKISMTGEFGCFESYDDGEVISSYMTHHQGMILASVCNYLCDGAIIKSLKKHPAVAAAELLLTQKEFDAVSKKSIVPAARKTSYEPAVHTGPCVPVRFNFLTNGRYSVAHGSDGEGWSQYGEISVSRNENNCGGLKIFIAVHGGGGFEAKNDNGVNGSVDNAIVNIGSRHASKTDRNIDDNTKGNIQGSADRNIDDKEAGAKIFAIEEYEKFRRDTLSESGAESWPFSGRYKLPAPKNDFYTTRFHSGPAHKAIRFNRSQTAAEPRVHDISKGNAIFERYKTVYEYRTPEFFATQTAIVLPNLDGEMRHVRLKNMTDKPLRVTVTSYFEPALCPKREDLSHKLFSSMKIRTRLEDGLVIASRADRPGLFVAHYIAFDDQNAKKYNAEYSGVDYSGIKYGNVEYGPVKYETSRHNLLRVSGRKLPSFGATVYPVLSGGKTIEIQPSSEIQFAAFILISRDETTLKTGADITLCETYLKQALSANFSLGIHLGMTRKTADLGSAILCAKFTDEAHFKRVPVVLVDVKHKPDGLSVLFSELARLQKFMEFNVAVCYREHEGYFHQTYDCISSAAENTGLKDFHILNYASDDKKIGRLKQIAVNPPEFRAFKRGAQDETRVYPEASLPAVEYDLELSGCGFLKDSSFYIDNFKTPRPWCNVIASEGIGTIVSDIGGGYTFFRNSHMGKLTAWSNDPYGDKPSEGVLLSEGDAAWSISRKPLEMDCYYAVRHAFGSTDFLCGYNGIVAELKEFIDMDSAKFYLVTLENTIDKKRDIDITFFANLVLGEMSENTKGFVACEFVDDALYAKNHNNGQSVFISADRKIEYYVRQKQDISPHSDSKNAKNINNTIFDDVNNAAILIAPCAAITVKLRLKPMEKQEAVFVLSVKKPYAGAELREAALRALEQSQKNYRNLSCLDISISGQPDKQPNRQYGQSEYSGEFPDELSVSAKSMNHLLRWLPYQTLCSRFFARAGFYQAGGAIGFRDQLQDCLALLYVCPQRVRRHILECAAHQFKEGDVQHWWHPPALGVRTKISDDLLYLPWITAEYIRFTGDSGILSQNVPYLAGRELAANEKDAYFEAEQQGSGQLYEHCVKALLYNRMDENGLVFMGGGDWNDAMDNVGPLGKGTTVFGSMFLHFVIEKFLQFVTEKELRNMLVERMEKLCQGINHAWEDEWFLRAFTDNGLVLGSKKGVECQIDLLTQSWASLSGAVDKRRVKTALKSVADRLIDFKNGVIKLLDPPFEKINAGYISRYPKGVRENGGQYTHAAVWYIMALLKEGAPDFAYSLLEMLNPVNHSIYARQIESYMAEPYVLCGDVYSGELSGTAGWSWYTGAAGWYYKCIVENVFGITIKGSKIFISPNLPAKIKNVKIKYTTDLGDIYISIDNSDDNLVDLPANKSMGKSVGMKSGAVNWNLYIDKVKYNVNYFMVTPAIVGKTVLLKKD